MPKSIDATAAIIVKAGRLFAARRKPGSHMCLTSITLAGFWEFPGGKLEEGETPEECLTRELAEEFGITVKVGTFFGESCYDYGTKVVRLLAYRVVHVAGDFELIAHDALHWLAIDELDEVEWAPADVALVELYKTSCSGSAEINKF